MNIYLWNYVIMIIEAAILLYNPDNRRGWDENKTKKKRKTFVILVCIQWILLIGLRADNIGADTGNYKRIFETQNALSWQDIFSKFSLFKEDFMEGLSAEIGYILFSKLVGSIWNHYGFFKFVVGSIFMISLGAYVYENSDEPFLCFTLFDGILFNLFAITGYRQVISVCIGMLWNYKNVKERKFVPFLLLLALAMLFHKSAIIFLVYYFLANKEITRVYVDRCLILIAIMIAFRSKINPFLASIMGYEGYTSEKGSGTQIFVMMYFALSAVFIWRRKAVKTLFPDSNYYYNAMICSGIMLSFALTNSATLRAVYNFLLITLPLLPQAMRSFEKKIDNSLAYVIVTSIFYLYILSKDMTYFFYWQ